MREKQREGNREVKEREGKAQQISRFTQFGMHLRKSRSELKN